MVTIRTVSRNEAREPAVSGQAELAGPQAGSSLRLPREGGCGAWGPLGAGSGASGVIPTKQNQQRQEIALPSCCAPSGPCDLGWLLRLLKTPFHPLENRATSVCRACS